MLGYALYVVCEDNSIHGISIKSIDSIHTTIMKKLAVYLDMNGKSNILHSSDNLSAHFRVSIRPGFLGNLHFTLQNYLRRP
jgi:hypothetical protein